MLAKYAAGAAPKAAGRGLLGSQKYARPASPKMSSSSSTLHAAAGACFDRMSTTATTGQDVCAPLAAARLLARPPSLCDEAFYRPRSCLPGAVARWPRQPEGAAARQGRTTPPRQCRRSLSSGAASQASHFPLRPALALSGKTRDCLCSTTHLGKVKHERHAALRKALCNGRRLEALPCTWPKEAERGASEALSN